jgi:hypothetical protein
MADLYPRAAEEISVAPDDRTLVIGIMWEPKCLELSRVDITEKPGVVDVAVYSSDKSCAPVGHIPAAS